MVYMVCEDYYYFFYFKHKKVHVDWKLVFSLSLSIPTLKQVLSLFGEEIQTQNFKGAYVEVIV